MFHGKEERDNLGRSWMEAPKEQRPAVEQAYLPKRWIHTWSGHTKGVNAIRSVLPSPARTDECKPTKRSQPRQDWLNTSSLECSLLFQELVLSVSE